MKKIYTYTVALILAASPVSALVAENFVCAAASSVSSVTLDGEVSYNILENEYLRYYATVVNSYLFENSDGTFTRVENINKNIVVENYTSDGKKISSQSVDFELELFGGFFKGKDANYFVFGQKNPKYDDNVEVVRVVKYSKDWYRISEASLYGANTHIPFDAGSLRMIENEGKLYVHTSHEMYAESDGINHQANLTFVVDEINMKITDSNYQILNIGQSGYVSHSFNQYIQSDGQYIYRVDHGDAYPRAVALTKAGLSNIKRVDYTLPFTISGNVGNNYTGVCIGGFELSENNCLIAGKSIDQENNESNSVNIFLTVTSKDLNSSKTIWLTGYTADDNFSIGNPHLVKYDDDTFVVIWHEIHEESTLLKYVTVNSEGEKTEEIKSVKVEDYYILSDCKPVKFTDGTIKWYSSDNESVSLYTLDLNLPEIVKGDINGDTKCDVADYMIMLKYLLGIESLSDSQKKNADLNDNDIINIFDVIHMKNILLKNMN